MQYLKTLQFSLGNGGLSGQFMILKAKRKNRFVTIWSREKRGLFQNGKHFYKIRFLVKPT